MSESREYKKLQIKHRFKFTEEEKEQFDKYYKGALTYSRNHLAEIVANSRIAHARLCQKIDDLELKVKQLEEP